MSKKHFHTLLKRYQRNECTEREKLLIERWFSLIDGEAPTHTPDEQRQVEERIWQAIQQKQQPDTGGRRHPIRPTIYWQWTAVAAVVLTVFMWLYPFQKNEWSSLTRIPVSNPVRKGLLTRTNTGNQPVMFRLVDGTNITLSPQSIIEYPRQFDVHKREVFLTGKAFFAVARNPKQPFLVYTGEVVTKVLGTSFWVNTVQNSQAVEVSVVSGKVSVFQRDARHDYVSDKVKSGVILTPNQRVTYTEQSQAFVTSLVEKPVLIAHEERPVAAAASFLFDDAPLSMVVEQLKKAYGIEIILENDRLNGCLFTADITNQPLFTKLDLLCSSLNASYEVRGTKILISGNGCTSF